MSLTTDALHELFEYKEGKLYRKVDRGNQKKGTEIKTKSSNGYLRTMINKKEYMVHRIIYQMFYGHIPRNLMIDHIDRNPLNNNIENLRAVSNQLNQYNTSATGVTYRSRRKKWEASIKYNGKTIFLGLHKNKEDAVDTYNKKKVELEQHLIMGQGQQGAGRQLTGQQK